MLNTLKELCHVGVVRQLDLQFGQFIASLETKQPELVGFLAGLVSFELGKGHICVPLDDLNVAERFGLFGDSGERLQARFSHSLWQQALQESECVSDGSKPTPLVLRDNSLYLNRYWRYESELADFLSLCAQSIALTGDQQTKLRQDLDILFCREYKYLFNALTHGQERSQVARQQLVCDLLDVVDSQGLDWPTIDQVLMSAKSVKDLAKLDVLVPLSICLNWQKVAAATALTRRFTVISGGPGTGKTTTVTKLLAALVQQADEKLDIKLVAPTGKAAARLTESIGSAIDELPLAPETKQAIPTEASTLHRLLGSVVGSAEFRHNKDNPLHLDVLVVDEASMVDLPMMYKLAQAMPAHARLILLGDKDQLASVEAGAVLGDICSFLSDGYTAQHAKLLATLTGFDALTSQAQPQASAMSDCLCMLQKSYRFDARSGIGQLAKAINAGTSDHLDVIWNKGFADIAKHPMSQETYRTMVDLAVTGYTPYLDISQQPITDAIAQQALNAFAKCRVLCAVREGECGLSGLNAAIETQLKRKSKIPTGEEHWYHGKPVMVTRNDPALGLFNGDIGLCLLDSSDPLPRLRVYFELPDGTIKRVLPSRVPEHETAYAMTIHKSQGSEFEHAIMVLPAKPSPILTRELVYTGVTRAKKQLDLFGSDEVLRRAVRLKTQRSSGLAQQLRG
ncbi:exodeoxyribonuclease V subunit alpha [Vibrio sp. SCSIO 43136]|uniref:exodeoxyribonuclease V subunit alpha n=1 Tax=Vibrio sp. SCSIO 43136 TaxID=2819101 RepID=UPI0020754AC4|nr:exodeoxyribonuclease V subunit alpha [Vibrio sp. SCSIO 43136]USD64719.1 exodeoxyribonuclease V subunit alpha [Vibrio sp. SCSIO 43136]